MSGGVVERARTSWSRRLALVLALVAVLSTVLSAGAFGSAAAAVDQPTSHGGQPGGDSGDGRPAAGRLLVISVPDLSWSEVGERTTPAIWDLVGDASVALMSTRTADEIDTIAAAYLTLGAGRRAGAAVGPTTGVAQQGPDGVVAVGFGEQVRRNDELRYGARPGALGAALAGAGVGVGVVGDAATDPDDPGGRWVALGTADESGRTPVGRVDGLLVDDPAAPGGVRLDDTAVVDAADQALQQNGVVFVEASDVYRAVRAGSDASVALERTDALIGALVDLVDPAQDDVLLVSPTDATGLRAPGVFAWRGPGVGPGLAESPTTRRAGYVALTDLAATVLLIAGVRGPSDVADTPVEPHLGTAPGSVADRVDGLAAAAARAIDRDRTVGPVAVTLVLLAIVCGLSGVVALWRHRRLPTWAAWLAATTIAAPGAAFTVGLWPGVGIGVVAVVAWIVAVAGIVGASGLRWGPERRWVPLPAALFTGAVLVLDVLAGGRLQIDTPLGYSATVAGRFAGLGNQASSYLLAATLAVIASGWVLLSDRGWSRRASVAVAAALGVAVVAVIGAPWWGSDVGGVLTALPALTVVIALSASRGRLGLRAVAAAVGALLAAGVLLFLVGLWDRGRAVADRTHLGRFVDDLLAGDALTVAERRLDAAWSVTTSTPWAVAVPLLLVALVSLAWLPGGRRWGVVTDRPELAAFGGAIAVAGVVGWVVNDSGVGVPAAMLLIAVPWVACVAPGGGGSSGHADGVGEVAAPVSAELQLTEDATSGCAGGGAS